MMQCVALRWNAGPLVGGGGGQQGEEGVAEDSVRTFLVMLFHGLVVLTPQLGPFGKLVLRRYGLHLPF